VSTPDGQQGSNGPNPREPAPQPPQPPGGQGTYNPENDIPRQQAPREDQSAGPRPGR
jgi:hypothetical protein